MRVGLTLICQFVRSSSTHHRPSQIALGITVGLLLGLLPKTTALFALVGVIGFLLPVHLPLLALTACTVTFAAPLLEAPLGQLGLWSLTHPRSASFWFRLDRFPLMPWLGIHNSVVHGTLMLWLLAAVPAYLCCLALSRLFLVDEVQQAVASIVDSFQLTSERAATIIPPLNQELRALTGPLEAGPKKAAITPPVVVWDDIAYGNVPDSTIPLRFDREKFVARYRNAESDTAHDEALTADEVLERSANLAAWAENLIEDELQLDSEPSQPTELNKLAPRAYAPNTSEPGIVNVTQAVDDDEERWLIETTMEVVRIAERAVTNQAALKAKQSEPSTRTGTLGGPTDGAKAQQFRHGDATSPNHSTEDPTVNQPQNSRMLGSNNTQSIEASGPISESSIRREQSPHSDHRSHLDNSRATANASGNRPREEALHYLLRHLKGIQEKAQKP